MALLLALTKFDPLSVTISFLLSPMIVNVAYPFYGLLSSAQLTEFMSVSAIIGSVC